MPTIDMPLAELREYPGTNPRPDDFDAYWSAALEEMRATEPCVEMVRADFQAPFAECFDLFFTGVRGARVHAKAVLPANGAPPRPAVLKFHGYSGDAGDWVELLPYAAMGFGIFALDCRGQGGLSEDVGGVRGNTLRGHIIRGLDDAPENLLFRHIFLDTAQLAGIVMELEEVDEARVGAMGVSQGGGLTLACGALEPRVARLAPALPFLCDYRRVWEMDLAKNAYQELQDYFRRFDPTHEREREVFTRLGYVDVQHLAPRIEGEVLMAVSLMDDVCPPSSQFAAYNKIRSEKRLEIYPDFGHEMPPRFQDKVFQFLAGLRAVDEACAECVS